MQVDKVIKLLDESGLLSAADVRTFERHFPDDRKPTTADALLDELVAAEKLTEHQASVLRTGTTKGLVLGEYTLLSKIGAGGMGQVFKARHRRLKRIVALKVLPPHAVDSESAVARFQQEMETMARLDHPNVVIAHDAGEADGIHFLVMQYVDGEDLAERVARSGTLSVADAVDFILQAARGLEYAHGEGVIHRDLKPSNLLVDASGTVRVLDMGLARFTNVGDDSATAAQLTGTGQIMGTVDFMSPEQATNTKNADHRSDIYSLGCTLHALLTKRPLFDGESVVEKILAHREQPIRSLAQDRADIPPQLDAIFQKMVAKHPDDRFQSMTAVVAQLAALQQQVPLSEQRPSASQSTVTSLSDPTQGGQHSDDQRTIGQGATVTTVKGPNSAREPAQQDTLSSYRPTEETHSDLRSRSSSTRRRHRALKKRSPRSAVPLVLIVMVGGALAFFLSQAKYRDIIAGVFKNADDKVNAGGDSPDGNANVVDLASDVELRRDAVAGNWRRDGSAIVSPDDDAARLQLSYSPPEQYDLTVVAEPVAGDNGLVLGLKVGGHQVTAVLGLKGNVSGLATDASLRFPDPATQHDGVIFTKGKPTTIVCRVRERRLTIEANGRAIIDYRGDPRHLTTFDLWTVPNRNVLFIGTAVTSFRITKIELALVGASGKPL